MKMSRVLDGEHHCSSFVTVSRTFSDVGDWMMNPLSTSTASTAIVNEIYMYRVYIITIICKTVYFYQASPRGGLAR